MERGQGGESGRNPLKVCTHIYTRKHVDRHRVVDSVPIQHKVQ